MYVPFTSFRERIKIVTEGIIIEKLTVILVIKEFSTFYVIRMYITVSTWTSQCSVSWSSLIQFTLYTLLL